MKNDQPAAITIPFSDVTPWELIEMVTIFSLAEYEFKLRGTPLHDSAFKRLEEARAEWKAKWKGKLCPCCGVIVE